MVEPVDRGLHFEQQFGVAHVAAQVRWHGGGIAEQRRKDGAIRGKDGIGGVEYVERDRAVVGVDGHLDAVAHVVDLAVAERVVGGVGIGFGGGEGVEHPGQAAVVADHDIGVRIEGEKWSQGLDAIMKGAPHQQNAVGIDVVAEGHLAQVAAVEGDQDAAQESSHAECRPCLRRT